MRGDANLTGNLEGAGSTFNVSSETGLCINEISGFSGG